MRLFIAVDVDDNIRENLKPVLKTLVNYRGVKTVEPENIHITIQFLGEVPESKVSAITDKLSNVAEKFEPFTAKLEGIGFFPNRGKIRVVWAGIISDEIVRLAKAVRKEMMKLGFREDKEFIAHATLARIKKISPSDRDRILKELDSFDVGGEWVIRDFKLKQSRLTPRGPIYTDVSVHRFD
ncbi:MAG: RNA 2',3'-cyclic phosphodiesterase [Archaeoglobus sp.]|nr:MAG: RNA 2',3'-cyclic phosphodiesterase [Archaeoglobus sp.]